jgi:hypothetical protein
VKTLDDIDIFETLEYIKRTAPKYAKAKATRIYLEEYRKSLKAALMATQIGDPVNAQERYAYAHHEYTRHLEAMQIAIQQEEEYRWKLVAAQALVEVWRSLSANQRAEAKVL